MVFYTRTLKSGMSKRMALAMLLAANGFASWADNQLRIENFSIKTNEEFVVSVLLDNDADITALSADLVLPTGLEIVDQNGDNKIDRNDFVLNADRSKYTALQGKHSLTASEQGGRKYRVTVANSKARPFTGNSGDEIFRFTVKATDAIGSNPSLRIANQELSRTDITAAPVKPGDTSASITVTKDVVDPTETSLTLSQQAFEINPYGTQTVYFNINNSTVVSGFSFKLELPEGITFDPDNDDVIPTERIEDWDLMNVTPLGDNTWNFYFATSEPSFRLSPGTGGVLGIVFHADNNLKASSDIVFKDINWADASAKQYAVEPLTIAVTNPSGSDLVPTEVNLTSAEPSFEIAPFDEAGHVVSVNLSNDGVVAGLSFDLQLPEGLVFDPESDFGLTDRTADMDPSVTKIGDLWRVQLAAFDPANRIQAGSGPIVNLVVRADETLPESAEINVVNASWSEYNSTQHSFDNFSITVNNPTVQAWQEAQDAVAKAKSDLSEAEGKITEELKDNAVVKAAQAAAAQAVDDLEEKVTTAYNTGKLLQSDYKEVDVPAAAEAAEALAKAVAEETALIAQNAVIDSLQTVLDDVEIPDSVAADGKVVAAGDAAAEAVKALRDKVAEEYGNKQLAAFDNTDMVKVAGDAIDALKAAVENAQVNQAVAPAAAALDGIIGEADQYIKENDPKVADSFEQPVAELQKQAEALQEEIAGKYDRIELKDADKAVYLEKAEALAKAAEALKTTADAAAEAAAKAVVEQAVKDAEDAVEAARVKVANGGVNDYPALVGTLQDAGDKLAALQAAAEEPFKGKDDELKAKSDSIIELAASIDDLLAAAQAEESAARTAALNAKAAADQALAAAKDAVAAAEAALGEEAAAAVAVAVADELLAAEDAAAACDKLADETADGDFWKNAAAVEDARQAAAGAVDALSKALDEAVKEQNAQAKSDADAVLQRLQQENQAADEAVTMGEHPLVKEAQENADAAVKAVEDYIEANKDMLANKEQADELEKLVEAADEANAGIAAAEEAAKQNDAVRNELMEDLLKVQNNLQAVDDIIEATPALKDELDGRLKELTDDYNALIGELDELNDNFELTKDGVKDAEAAKIADLAARAQALQGEAEAAKAAYELELATAAKADEYYRQLQEMVGALEAPEKGDNKFYEEANAKVDAAQAAIDAAKAAADECGARLAADKANLNVVADSAELKALAVKAVTAVKAAEAAVAEADTALAAAEAAYELEQATAAKADEYYRQLQEMVGALEAPEKGDNKFYEEANAKVDAAQAAIDAAKAAADECGARLDADKASLDVVADSAELKALAMQAVAAVKAAEAAIAKADSALAAAAEAYADELALQAEVEEYNRQLQDMVDGLAAPQKGDNKFFEEANKLVDAAEAAIADAQAAAEACDARLEADKASLSVVADSAELKELGMQAVAAVKAAEDAIAKADSALTAAAAAQAEAEAKAAADSVLAGLKDREAVLSTDVPEAVADAAEVKAAKADADSLVAAAKEAVKELEEAMDAAETFRNNADIAAAQDAAEEAMRKAEAAVEALQQAAETAAESASSQQKAISNQRYGELKTLLDDLNQKLDDAARHIDAEDADVAGQFKQPTDSIRDLLRRAQTALEVARDAYSLTPESGLTPAYEELEAGIRKLVDDADAAQATFDNARNFAALSDKVDEVQDETVRQSEARDALLDNEFLEDEDLAAIDSMIGALADATLDAWEAIKADAAREALADDAVVKAYEDKLDSILKAHEDVAEAIAAAQQDYDLHHQVGDVDGDTEVDINDYNRLLLYLKQPSTKPTKESDPELFARLDVNGDGRISISDAAAVINCIWYDGNPFGPDGARQMSASEETLMAESSMADGRQRVALSLSSENAYVGYQFDVVLPEGATIAGVQLAERSAGHSVVIGDKGNGVATVVVSSATNKVLAGTDGVLLYIDVEGSGQVQLENVEFADVSAQAHELAVAGAQTTGIAGVKAAEDDEQVFGIGGRLMNAVKKGINIIRRADGTTKKVIK